MAAPAIGSALTLIGQVSLRRGANELPIKEGDPIEAADLLKTSADSRLVFRLGERTLITLGPATTLRVERYLADAGGAFELVNGRMVYQNDRTDPRAPADKTIVRSPYGLLAVRGTHFFAGPTAGSFSVFVAKGRVDVSAASTTVRLTSGLGTDIRQPGQSPSQPKSWKPPRIREAFLSTTGRPRP
jgi:hypothetical protein